MMPNMTNERSVRWLIITFWMVTLGMIVGIPAQSLSQPESFPATTSSIINTPETRSLKIGFLNANKVNIRQGPGLDEKVVAKIINKGSAVKVLGKEGEWIKIFFTDTQQGWIFGKYLNIKEIEVVPEGKKMTPARSVKARVDPPRDSHTQTGKTNKWTVPKNVGKTQKPFNGHPKTIHKAKAYRIGPRDVLTISIYAGGEKQHESSLTVSAQGTINAPFIGSFRAEGLTPTQLEKQITAPLASDYFVDPKVNIQIAEYHSLQYYITGAVKLPGLYNMTSEATLLVLIAKAGGLLPERGNQAYILRGSADAVISGAKVQNLVSRSEPLKVDLRQLIEKGDMRVNLILQPGDVVYIPLKASLDLAESKIYLEGEVKHPGAYDFLPGMTALNACIMGGGFDTFAAPNRTKIIRSLADDQREIIKINLNQVKAGKIPDVELKPGDRIHVPETWL
jgi:polysaccharide export outer membrane protein